MMPKFDSGDEVSPMSHMMRELGREESTYMSAGPVSVRGEGNLVLGNLWYRVGASYTYDRLYTFFHGRSGRWSNFGVLSATESC